MAVPAWESLRFEFAPKHADDQTGHNLLLMLELKQELCQLHGTAHGALRLLVKIDHDVYFAELTCSRKRCVEVQQYLNEVCSHTAHKVPTRIYRKQLESNPQSL